MKNWNFPFIIQCWVFKDIFLLTIIRNSNGISQKNILKLTFLRKEIKNFVAVTMKTSVMENKLFRFQQTKYERHGNLILSVLLSLTIHRFLRNTNTLKQPSEHASLKGRKSTNRSIIFSATSAECSNTSLLTAPII